MKKLILITLALSCCMAAKVDAQCKYFKKVPKMWAKSTEQCVLAPEAITKAKPLFQKYRTAGSILMIKSGEKYYMTFFMMRNNSSRFDLLKDNSLDLMLSDGSKVALFPCNDFSGHYQGLSLNYMICSVYDISKAQLQKLEHSQVIMVSIHYTAEKELSGSQVDSEGKFSLDYEVASKKYQDSASLLSACILSK